jgi:hypothetical protein
MSSKLAQLPKKHNNSFQCLRQRMKEIDICLGRQINIKSICDDKQYWTQQSVVDMRLKAFNWLD